MNTVTDTFTFSLVKETSFRGVLFQLYTSTNGWFVETSDGLVSEYMKTKKEAIEYIKSAKNTLEIEGNE